MELHTRVLDIPANMVTLQISGKITSNFLGDLEDELERLSSGPRILLIIDIGKVDSVDSQGIGVLIKARNDIVAKQGKVVIIGITKRVSTVLKISGLDSYFPIAHTEYQAIKLLEEESE